MSLVRWILPTRRPLLVVRVLSLLVLLPLPAMAIDIAVDVLDDPTPNGCTPGSCSLREAVILANSLAGPDRILLPATPGLPLQLSIAGNNESASATGDLDVRDDLEVVGAGADATLLVQTTDDRVFQTSMSASGRLTLRGLTIQGGNAIQGGAVQSAALLTIEDAALINNRSSFEGGAIRYDGGYSATVTGTRLVLRRVVFRGNRSTQTSGTGTGGAIFANSFLSGQPFLLAEDCTFEDNEAKDGGGAIWISGNPSQFGGGVLVRRTTFQGNRTGGSGGAALAAPAFTSFDVQVEDSRFEDNVTTSSDDGAGGAVDFDRVNSASFVRTTFVGNSGNTGGAIHSLMPMRIVDSHFFDNQAVHTGGAVRGGTQLLVLHSTFESNRLTTTASADDGGGALSFSGQTMAIQRSTFSGNDAYRGGAISLVSGGLQLYGSTVVAAPTGVPGRIATALRFRDDGATHLSIANTILAGSCSFPSVSLQLGVAYNTIESPGATCRLASASLSSANQTAVSADDLALAPLADNGGPTWTHRPLAGSVALDAARANYCTPIDQRHFVGIDGQCDIGAVEAGAIDDILFANGLDLGG